MASYVDVLSGVAWGTATYFIVQEKKWTISAHEEGTQAGDADEPRSPPRRFENLSDLLLSSPFAGANLDLTRSKDQPRTIDLG
jgi:hypothetical protein